MSEGMIENVSSLKEEGGFNLLDLIYHHLQDEVIYPLSLGGIDISITKRVVMLWIGSILLCLFFIPVARKIAQNPYRVSSRFQALVEVLVEFVRKDMVESVIHKKPSLYAPFILTLFFFILFSNLLGLVPPLGGGIVLLTGEKEWANLWPGITATGDISVTAALAVVSFVVYNLAGFIHQGPLYIRNLVPAGVPILLYPILWPIELLGKVAKAFALTIRLLANMTAGHTVILVLLGFIFQFKSYLVAFISVIGASLIYLLEIFVAFLQAYIFAFLTALFIGESQHRH